LEELAGVGGGDWHGLLEASSSLLRTRGKLDLFGDSGDGGRRWQISLHVMMMKGWMLVGATLARVLVPGYC